MTPRPPLVVLLSFTLVSVCALGWFAWKVLEQERLVEAQRSQERLEQEADRLAITIRARLADAGDRLANSPLSPAPGLTLARMDSGMAASAKLLFWPVASSDPEADPRVYREAEQVEFGQGQLAAALTLYDTQASSADRAIRAGALWRKARVLRRLNRVPEAVAAYFELAKLPGVGVGGVPADLAARLELKNLAGVRGVREDLLAGKWQLSRAQFEFFWSQLSQDPPPASKMELAEAAQLAWERHRSDRAARGEETFWIGSKPYFLIWRGVVDRRTLLIARPADFLHPDDLAFTTLLDAEGRTLAGKGTRGARAAVRQVSTTSLPWTIFVAADPGQSASGFLLRDRLLLLGMGVLLVFLTAGTYFVAQAIRREAEMVRLQADFVAAVSHEFRSPLTSMRQLSELLAEGRVPSEDRRVRYYRTLVAEARRLQRLVEGLLNFGNMDAGGLRLRRERADAGILLRQVAGEFEPERIEILASGGAMDADPEAVALALRNLVDNALKYSEQPVAIEQTLDGRDVVFRVRDAGPGIPASEQRAIFRKFVRGSGAASGKVKGSGIGLALVAHIASAHGGSISVESELGAGSTFTLRFPALSAAGEPQPVAEES